jgi:hypothetical protein
MAKLDPTALYKIAEIRDALKIGPRTIGNAIASGRLKFSQVGQERFIQGQWAIDWIAGGANAKAETQPA